MARFPVRKAGLVGAVLAACVSPARADHHPPCPPGPGPGAPAAPAFRTVLVTECVPETYQARRVSYRAETRVEKYTAHRCQLVPEVRDQVVTTYKHVPEVRTVIRRVCVNVPTVEERTVMRPHWTTQQVVTYRTRCVERGHYECREVYSHRAAMRNRMHRWRHRDDCDPCPPPPCTKTVKVWVPCMVTEQVPVVTCKRVCVMRPEVVRVTVCRQEVREEQVNVTYNRCVPVQQTVKCTVMVSRMVPYEATRCVTVCVPHEELVTCTRMVARTVARQVPVDTCAESCFSVCGTNKDRHSRFGGRWFRGRDCCH